MKDKVKREVKQQPLDQPKTGKVPWIFQLEVKDLIKPIIIRRVQILQFGFGLLFLIASGVFIWHKFFGLPTGVEVVQKMVEAAGGMDAWHNIKNGQFTRTKHLYSESGDLLSEKVETFFFKRTDEGLKLLVKSMTLDGEEVWIGKDDKGYWASQDKKAVDPVLTARGLGMMCDSKWCEPLCASSMAFYRFSMPFKLTDPGVNPALGGIHMLSGIEEALMLDITYDPKVGKDRWVFYINPLDFLIRKLEYHHTTDKGESHPEEIFWSDHRTEFGITFSHKWTRYWANGKVLEEYTFSDVDFETELAENYFDRPEDHGLLTSVGK